jgi:hypothetical protein
MDKASQQNCPIFITTFTPQVTQNTKMAPRLLFPSAASRRFAWYAAAIMMLASLAGAAQLDILISETLDAGVTVTIKGNIDTTSGMTMAGTDEPNSFSPVLKVGKKEDGSRDFVLLDQKDTAMSYYTVQGGAWKFDCVIESANLFTFVDPSNGESFANSIGMFVTSGGAQAMVILSATGDYSRFDETGTMAVGTAAELGLVTGTTCTMTFGTNLIQVTVVGYGEEKELSANVVPTESPVMAPTTSALSAQSSSKAPTTNAVPAQSSSKVLTTNDVPTQSPSKAPTCDLFCSAAAFIGGVFGIQPNPTRK